MDAACVVVEYEVLAEAEDIVAVLEVLVLFAAVGEGTCNLGSGPVSAEVVHCTPLVQGYRIPAGPVYDIDAYSAMLRQGLYGLTSSASLYGKA